MIATSINLWITSVVSFLLLCCCTDPAARVSGKTRPNVLSLRVDSGTLHNAAAFLTVNESQAASSRLTEMLKHQTNTSNDNGSPVIDSSVCHLKQTMAWADCGKQIQCPTSCSTSSDCTFPYCDSQGKCVCREAFCHNDEMCDFFRIECPGKFVCRSKQCLCEINIMK